MTHKPHEKDQFLELLHDLCTGVTEPAPPKTGRPRLPLRDAVFAVCFKIYSTLSCRRFMSDIRDAHSKGYLSRVPHFNSICNYLENPEMTPISALVDYRNELAFEFCGGGFCRRLVRLHHVALRTVVRS